MISEIRPNLILDPRRDERLFGVPSHDPTFRLHRLECLPFLNSPEQLLFNVRMHFHHWCYSQAEGTCSSDDEALAALTDSQYSLYESAVSRLIGCRSEHVLSSLIQLSEETGWNVRPVLTLGLLITTRPSRKAIERRSEKRHQSRLEKTFYDWVDRHDEPKTKAVGIAALGCLQSLDDSAQLLRLCDHEDHVVVCEAVGAIGNLRLVNYFEKVEELALTHPFWTVRRSAAAALFKLKRNRARPALIQLIRRDESTSVVTLALEALDRLKHAATPALILARLRKADEYMRSDIVATIAVDCKNLDYSPAIQYLVPRKHIRDEGHFTDALMCCIALRKAMTGKAQTILHRIVSRHAEADIRMEAAKSLGLRQAAGVRATLLQRARVDAENAMRLRHLYCALTNTEHEIDGLLGHLLFDVIGSDDLTWVNHLLGNREFEGRIGHALRRVCSRYKLEYDPLDIWAGIAPGLWERANESFPFGWAPDDDPKRLPGSFVKSVLAETHKAIRGLVPNRKHGRANAKDGQPRTKHGRPQVVVSYQPPDFFASQASNERRSDFDIASNLQFLRELLSPVDYEVLYRWIGLGERHDEIAQRCGVSVRQVGRIVARIKATIAQRAELIR